jgi:recombination protein RecA
MSKIDEALNEAIKKLNKKYDSSSVMKVGEMEYTDIKTFSTGCHSLDWCFSCGGLPIGRVIEIYGNPSTGKTSLALFILGQVQKQKGKVMFIDMEASFDKSFSEKLGVNADNLFLSQPETGEEAFSIIEEIARTGKMDVIVVDSVSSLVPRAELEGGVEKNNIASQARLVSKGLRILTGILSRSETTVIFINQVRMQTGIYFGNPETTSGGKSLKFYSSVRLQVRNKKIKGKDEEIIGSRLFISCVKNKTGVPFRKTEIDLFFESGIDLSGDILDTGMEKEIIEKAGNTYMYGKEKLGVGREQAKNFLSENFNVVSKIKKDLDAKLKTT